MQNQLTVTGFRDRVAIASCSKSRDRIRTQVEIKGVKADGRLALNSFVVVKHSQVVLTDRASSHGRTKAEKLLRK